ncbi:MAG: hypothetical protein LBQ81_12830 [Zoogloeaceae bacterium]|jgi:hypothetical protein|nr:hypothetical protein [Zoogloeaceae bacterium]
MDITSVGLQAPFGSAGSNASGAVSGIQQTNGANNAARNANIASDNAPPASTRVTISDEGLSRLAAEQIVGAGGEAGIPAIAPDAREAAAATALPPVTQAAAAASVEAGASAAVGQGVTQAAASTPATQPAAAGPTANATAGVASNRVGGAPDTPETSNTSAQAATPETSNVVRQAVDENAQQAQVRQNDAAASRQDVSPVLAQGANASRSALAA